MKILFISLGCDKNLVDTEVMLGLLASRGYEMTDDEAEADIIVINTCCFIHDAKAVSYTHLDVYKRQFRHRSPSSSRCSTVKWMILSSFGCHTSTMRPPLICFLRSIQKLGAVMGLGLFLPVR